MSGPAPEFTDQRILSPTTTARPRPAPASANPAAAATTTTTTTTTALPYCPSADHSTTTIPSTGDDSWTLPDTQVRPRHARASMGHDIDPTSTPPPLAASPSTSSHMAAPGGRGPADSTRDPGGMARHQDEGVTSPESASAQKLNDYRERLARDLERREVSARALLLNSSEKRVSPIPEETASLPPPSTGPTTASTESANTVRGAMTPGNLAGTPSYPFPRMPSWTTQGSRAFTPAHGPPSVPSFYPAVGAQDRVLSNDSTPASFVFNPSGLPPRPDQLEYPEPNLYELSLMLSAEPGLDAWWNTVVQIMRDVYMAERVTLAVPADSTDIENVPWGQKATYNGHQNLDEFSVGYMGRRTASTRQLSDFDSPRSAPYRDDTRKPTTPVRPDLLSRHSFTSYEDSKSSRSPDQNPVPAQRPSDLRRSRSYRSQGQGQGQGQGQVPSPSTEHWQLSRGALETHDLLEDGTPAWETPYPAEREDRGRVLPVLQALAYEADPLIDHTGVNRVLERGKTITLTRTYPYLEDNDPSSPEGRRAGTKVPRGPNSPRRPPRQRPESSSIRPPLFGNPSSSRGSLLGKGGAADKGKGVGARLGEEGPRPPTPDYEEFEQPPPSPWSQSPAPSPAIRAESKENPFFTDAAVDESTFTPAQGTKEYTAVPSSESVGVDNSWTVLHIPLTHVLLSKPTRPFRFDSKADAQSRGGSPDADTPGPRPNPRAAPIAILSILSPTIPYPTNLRHSLEHLAPHMATSFSLCRHYDNLETEVAGLQRRRPSTTGFGAVALDGRPLTSTPFPSADVPLQPSHTGSLTSPSEYSGVSKSMTGSPAGTPGWEQASLGNIADKRTQAVSPAAVSYGGEGYFSSKQRGNVPMRHEVLGTGAPRKETKDGLPVDRRHARVSSIKINSQEPISPAAEWEETQSVPPGEPHSGSKPPSRGHQGSGGTPAEETSSDAREAPRHDRTPSHGQNHTMLHSYGADFASTFQSLPPSSTLSSRPPSSSTQARSVSYVSSATAADMPPPSDRLKGLMLDALPAHVFVALPQTGEVVWVNSRYLSYRGQTVADLAEDPWSSIHPDDCEEYLKAWGHCLRTGEQFSRTVRIRRFDGQYRWFYARAVASKDKRGVIMQFLGSYMDIHDQHIAELKAARQEEIEASEAKHRLLANLIPQIIFTATEEDGITFSNEQWLSYTGRDFDDLLGLGFLECVHPEDLARCHILVDQPPTPLGESPSSKMQQPDAADRTGKTRPSRSPTEVSLRGVHKALSRHNSVGNGSIYEVPSADLAELAKKGIIKVGTDSNGRLSYTTEVRLRSKTGEYRWHLIRCVEIDTIDFGSGASSYFGSATDINDHKILETKLKEAMEAKGRFLSNMSHEIRTPLIGISGMVSFLQDTVLNEEQRDYTNTIQTSANSLIMIINDILDLSKVDAGMMKLKFEWFHTSALIEDVNELVSAMAIAKGLELNYLVEADVPAWVKGDKVRIRQVLLNVIGNAIKFTSQGEVFSHCRVSHDPVDDDDEENSNGIMLEYAIIDTGQGFTQQEADLIFKPFSQIDGSSTRQHGGSGLGLVISKQLVELHGGKMSGTATPGKGSKFVFSARFGLPSADDHPDFPESPASGSLATDEQDESSLGPASTGKSAPPPAQDRSGAETRRRRSATAGSAVLAADIANLDRPAVTEAGKPTVAAVSTGLARFSEAAKASGQDLTQMKLEVAPNLNSPSRSLTPSPVGQSDAAPDSGPAPPVYSILIICPQKYSREATTRHIEMTLPKDMPHEITALQSVEEARTCVEAQGATKFTHVVINLGSAEAVMNLLDEISRAQTMDKMTILILSDSVQRQAVMKLAAGTQHEKMLSANLVTFIYKPVKPSRFGVIFDPDKMRDLSIDRNRSTAQRMVETQKASYKEIAKRMGNKGYRVLLVEDNPVNQKVLKQYLVRIGVEVELAVDGIECTDTVLSKGHSYYSLILCDLHMPRKDGYQACREIRQWEKTIDAEPMPIIALSANVMLEVKDKCLAAGFSAYVTKPVDFMVLSKAIVKFF